MKGIPEEHEKRRSVFWELLNMDCRMVCMTIRWLDFAPIIDIIIFFLKNRVFHLDGHLQYSLHMLISNLRLVLDQGYMYPGKKSSVSYFIFFRTSL